MKQIGYNLKYVRPENDYSLKISQSKFNRLLESLDKTHEEVKQSVKGTSNIRDRDEYLKNHKLDFSGIIRKKGHFKRLHDSDSQEENNKTMRDPKILHQIETVNQRKLDYLDIKPKVNTNLPLTKEEQEKIKQQSQDVEVLQD